MLTDYMVTCPRPGCHWSGSLLPAGSLEVWRPAIPSTNVIVFCCPRCQTYRLRALLLLARARCVSRMPNMSSLAVIWKMAMISLIMPLISATTMFIW